MGGSSTLLTKASGVQCTGGMECGAVPHVSGQASRAGLRAQKVLREEAACCRHRDCRRQEKVARPEDKARATLVGVATLLGSHRAGQTSRTKISMHGSACMQCRRCSGMTLLSVLLHVGKSIRA